MTAKRFLRPGVARASRPRRISAAFWVLFVAFAGGISLRYLRGPALALSRFEFEGTRRARTRELMAAVAPFERKNLLLLNLAPVASAVEKVPWVERVTVSKVFPDALRVSVHEKKAIAFCRIGSSLSWLDASGEIVAPYDPREETGDYPVITATLDLLPAAASLLASLQREIPAYASAVSEIWSIPSGGFALMDSSLRIPIYVAAQDAPTRIRELLSLRSEIVSRGLAPRGVDLRFERRVVLLGAFGGGKSV
ncbi:MAG: cell division protein FtsQ/DivIB [Thermoanaerobaculia bacterium]